jgi:hypothetical protein
MDVEHETPEQAAESAERKRRPMYDQEADHVGWGTACTW